MNPFRYLAAVVAAGLLSLAVVACSQPVEPSENFALTSLSETEDAVIDTADEERTERTWVIRTQEDFQRLWDRFFASRTDRPMPTIDFATQMVVVVSMGPQPTAGYAVRITGVRRTERGIVVLVTTLSPGPNCTVAQVRTHPVAISRLRKTDRPIQFEFTRQTRDCTGR